MPSYTPTFKPFAVGRLYRPMNRDARFDDLAAAIRFAREQSTTKRGPGIHTSEAVFAVWQNRDRQLGPPIAICVKGRLYNLNPDDAKALTAEEAKQLAAQMELKTADELTGK